MWSLGFDLLKSIGSKWLDNKKAKDDAKFTRELEIIRGERTADISSADGMATSLKDEFLTIVLTIPLIVIFYAAIWGDPAMIAQVKEAFEAMTSLPDWYQWCFMGCVAATFGLRSIKTLGK